MMPAINQPAWKKILTPLKDQDFGKREINISASKLVLLRDAVSLGRRIDIVNPVDSSGLVVAR